MTSYRDSQRYRKTYSYYRPVPRATDTVADKNYIDTVVQGLDWKQSVRFASTGDISLVAPGTIDGGTLNDEDRVLLKNQAATMNNGIYVYYTSSNSLVRALDAQQDTLTSGAAVYVEEGITNPQTVWFLTTIDPITVDTTPQVWALFSSVTSIFTRNVTMAKTNYSASFGGGLYVTDIGKDVFFFVSGSKGATNGNTPGVASFGGDVVISGTLWVSGVIGGGSSTNKFQSSFYPGTGVSGSSINFGTPMGYQMSSASSAAITDKKKNLDVYFNGIRLAYTDDYEVINMHTLALTFDYVPTDKLYIAITDAIAYP